MSVNYTFLYCDQKNKLILSEPNPFFNKDLRETANRKYLFNQSAREMMSRLIKVFSAPFPSAQTLDTALYFRRLEVSSNDEKTSSVAHVFLNLSTKNGVCNSNIDFNLNQLMQEFAAASDVYFGWSDYYICSVKDFMAYVKHKSSRKLPVMQTFEEMCQNDLYIKEKQMNYEGIRYYNSWLSWLPFGWTARQTQETLAKQLVDSYYQEKLNEYNKTKEAHLQYEKDLDSMLQNILDNMAELPATATNVSLLLKIGK